PRRRSTTPFPYTTLFRSEERISPATRVVIGHSLGSIVAYEALCKHPEWQIDTFVTLGSPLGIQRLVFDALVPRPEGGHGAWPHRSEEHTSELQSRFDRVC